MSANYSYPSPVFMVDSESGQFKHHQYHQQQVPRRTDPAPVPCWTFPPARAEMKRSGWGRTKTGLAWILTLILLLIFAALGLGTYQIMRLQNEMERLTQEMPTQIQSIAPKAQVGLKPPELDKAKQKIAAHLIGRADQGRSTGTLQWEPKLGEAFTEGIKYSNGGLQVNETGLYFVYARAEFLAHTCIPRDSLTHTVFVLRNARNLTIMQDHREGFCVAGGKQPWMAGSNLGSLQHLKEADWLYVNVSHPNLLSKYFQNNYFGVFKIH